MTESELEDEGDRATDGEPIHFRHDTNFHQKNFVINFRHNNICMRVANNLRFRGVFNFLLINKLKKNIGFEQCLLYNVHCTYILQLSKKKYYQRH